MGFFCQSPKNCSASLSLGGDETFTAALDLTLSLSSLSRRTSTPSASPGRATWSWAACCWPSAQRSACHSAPWQRPAPYYWQWAEPRLSTSRSASPGVVRLVRALLLLGRGFSSEHRTSQLCVVSGLNGNKYQGTNRTSARWLEVKPV